MQSTPGGSEQDCAFSVFGDGRMTGEDRFGGELARMTLYVARALAQVDEIMGVGNFDSLRAEGGTQELALQVAGQGSGFDSRVNGWLSGAASLPKIYAPNSDSPARLEQVLDMIAGVELVAGCFMISPDGRLLAEKVPGMPHETMAGAGRRVKVAHDAFAQMLRATHVVATFEWLRLVTTAVGNGIAVAITDPSSDTATVVSISGAAGARFRGVDLNATTTAP